mmetsp:Transcript_19707/g.47578  ORF Transcript_19707/g.47578 Transcript_19707/m.47578 type:complete len:864 (+) Transcript_19707:200-2791(+)
MSDNESKPRSTLSDENLILRAAREVDKVWDSYFEQNKDIISKDGPKLSTFDPHEDSLLGTLWKGKQQSSCDDTHNVPSIHGTAHIGEGFGKADTDKGFLKPTGPLFLLSGLDDLAEKQSEAKTKCREEAEGPGYSSSSSAATTTTTPADLAEDGQSRHYNIFSQPQAYRRIEEKIRNHPSFLYGTSGAGKTRTVFEYLSVNKGMYFLGSSDYSSKNPGSEDFCQAIFDAEMIKIPESELGTDAATTSDDTNRTTIHRRMALAMFVRYAIHDKIEKHILGRKMTPYEWLLYQLFPRTFLGGNDLFYITFDHVVSVFQGEGKNIPILTIRDWRAHVGKIDFQEWPVFVDEAQEILKHQKRHFVSRILNDERSESTSSKQQFRSLFSAVFGGLTRIRQPGKVLYPVFSGTGISFDQLTEEASSMTVKNLMHQVSISDVVFSEFEVLRVEDVKDYLSRFLDLSLVSDPVVEHTCKWLRGRPRWVASFLEVYSNRKGKEKYEVAGIDAKSLDYNIMQALHRYLMIITTHDGEETKEHPSFNAGRRSAYALFQNILHGSGNNGFVFISLLGAVGRFAVGEMPYVFCDENVKRFIEVGLCTIHQKIPSDKKISGSFDEPIINEAGINYFGLQSYLKHTLAFQTPGGQGEAFEYLLLSGMMKNKSEFQSFLKDNLHGDASKLEGFHPRTLSAYGVLCRYTGDVHATLDWLNDSVNATFEGQVPPFCLPDVNIGPDIIFLLRNDNFVDFRACLMQSKYVEKKTDHKSALLTLVSDLLYFQRRGKEDERISAKLDPVALAKWNTIKEQFISPDRPCLRIYVNTTDSTSQSSGPVASNTATPRQISNKEKDQLLIVINNNNLEDVFAFVFYCVA